MKKAENLDSWRDEYSLLSESLTLYGDIDGRAIVADYIHLLRWYGQKEAVRIIAKCSAETQDEQNLDGAEVVLRLTIAASLIAGAIIGSHRGGRSREIIRPLLSFLVGKLSLSDSEKRFVSALRRHGILEESE
mgnify:CR=1 FL=1